MPPFLFRGVPKKGQSCGKPLCSYCLLSTRCLRTWEKRNHLLPFLFNRQTAAQQNIHNFFSFSFNSRIRRGLHSSTWQKGHVPMARIININWKRFFHLFVVRLLMRFWPLLKNGRGIFLFPPLKKRNKITRYFPCNFGSSCYPLMRE